MDLGKKLTEEIEARVVIDIKLFGIDLSITDTVIVMWIIMAFILIFSLVITKNMKLIPKGKQNLAETIVEFFNNFTKNIIGHHWKVFSPYIGTVALFLIFANTISIFNIIPDWEQLSELTHINFLRHLPEIKLKPPTRDINVTLAFAVMSMVTVIFGSIRVKRVSGWLKTFVHPVPIMLPFNILDYLIRPTSLCLRLFGNILGAFIVMELVYMALPPILPAALSIYFDLFDGILQAYVFVFLSTFYIAETVE